MHHPRLLPGHQRALAIRQIHQTGRRAEIEIRSIGLRTIVPGRTREIEGVAGGHLPRPQHLARIHIEPHEGVASGRRRVGVGVAGSHVHCALLQIQRGRGPHGRARWPPQLRALLVLSNRVRRFRNRVSLPDLLSGRRIQRRHPAAEFAAFILRPAAGDFLVRGIRNIQPSVGERRSACDHGRRMIFHAHLPQQRAGGRIHGVSLRALVAEIHYPARAQRTYADGAAHLSIRPEYPVSAAGRGVQRINSAGVAAQEDSPSRHGGLRKGANSPGEAECPLQFQSRNLLRVQAGHGRRLHAVVGRVHAPAVPVRTGKRPIEIRRRIRA